MTTHFGLECARFVEVGPSVGCIITKTLQLPNFPDLNVNDLSFSVLYRLVLSGILLRSPAGTM